MEGQGMMIAINNIDTHVDLTCKYCKVNYTILVNKNDMMLWLTDQGYAQDLMPYLSAVEREMIISGTCGKCWAKLFGEDFYDREDNVSE